MLPLGICLVPTLTVEEIPVTALERQAGLEELELVHTRHRCCTFRPDGDLPCACHFEYNFWLKKVPDISFAMGSSTTSNFALRRGKGS